jgi:hypothetical protein
MMAPRRVFGVLTLVLGLMLVVGTILCAGVGGTFGLLSGLVVLMVPAWLLYAQALGGAIVTCAALWRGAPRGAAVLGSLAVAVPGAAVVLAYGAAYAQCLAGPDEAGCLDYLNGSPLLPFFVGVTAVLTLGEVAVVLGVARFARRQGQG